MKLRLSKALWMRLLYAHALVIFIAIYVFSYSYLSTGYRGSFIKFSTQLIQRDGIVLTFVFGYLVFLVILVVLPSFRGRRKHNEDQTD